MKKYFIFAAAALVSMAACSKISTLEMTPESEKTPVGFSAYSGSPVTKGIVDTAAFTGIAKEGIGVFAFYQPANNGVEGPNYTTIKYPTPDFMYNQKVNCATKEGVWEYSPVKYWPNNLNDKLSFFAYAPYVSATTWEDLGISTDATGTTIKKTFQINNDIADQTDYLFARPVLNMKKPVTVSDTTGRGKMADGGDVIKFKFSHVTSKVNLYIGVDSADVVTNTPLAWHDANTTIEVKSIEFKDLAQSFVLSCGTDTTIVASGKQNIVAKPYVSTSPATNYGFIDNTWVKGWHRFLQGTQVDDTTTAVDETQTTTSTDQYMFLAPQALKNEEIIITYVVKTEASNVNNNSEITNVIKKTWADFHNASFTKFESGKQYNLYFLIGMQSVKLAATSSPWVDGTNHTIDVPTVTGN